MIKTIIIEDEEDCAVHLTRLLLSNHTEEIEVLGVFSTYQAGLDALLKYRPALVFLDINLGDKTGFELLGELQSIPFNVIFTTAYHEFAIKAFRMSAVDFLMKPILPVELGEAIRKVEKGVLAERQLLKYQMLLESVNSTMPEIKKIAITHLSGFRVLDLSDIIRLQADGSYTQLFIANEPKLVSARTLREFEDRLTEHRFIRVHNSHLVNLNYVTNYTSGKGGYLTLKDNTQIEVSHRKKDILIKYLHDDKGFIF